MAIIKYNKGCLNASIVKQCQPVLQLRKWLGDDGQGVCTLWIPWTEALVCVLGRTSYDTARFYCPTQKGLWFKIRMIYYWNVPFNGSQLTCKHGKSNHRWEGLGGYRKPFTIINTQAKFALWRTSNPYFMFPNKWPTTWWGRWRTLLILVRGRKKMGVCTEQTKSCQSAGPLFCAYSFFQKTSVSLQS